MRPKILPVSSSLAAVETLYKYFGNRLIRREALVGQTFFEASLDHRDYLANLGVPPDRRYPSPSSLQHAPLVLLFHLLHAENKYAVHNNGTAVHMFVGPSHPTLPQWDCRGTLAYRMGFRPPHTLKLLSGQTPHQRRLLFSVAERLEELLTQEPIQKT